jgi:lactoylglutathione lyase
MGRARPPNFGASAGRHYANPLKGFESCFLTFDGGTRLEVMKTTTLSLSAQEPGKQLFGLAHLAIEVGADLTVDEMTRRLLEDGIPILDGSRRTGDGYYEAVVLDPDGNRVEMCAAKKALLGVKTCLKVHATAVRYE